MNDSLLDEPDVIGKIRLQERVTYQLLYQFVYPSIARYVRKNSGNEADAEDVFQETLLVLVEKAKQPDFRLTSSLRTYLFAIAKNVWLKRLRQQRIRFVDDLSILDSACELPADDSREDRVGGWLAKVTPMCRMLLRALFYDNEPMERLMHHMGWKNKHTADNQKYKCVQQIRKVAD